MFDLSMGWQFWPAEVLLLHLTDTAASFYKNSFKIVQNIMAFISLVGELLKDSWRMFYVIIDLETITGNVRRLHVLSYEFAQKTSEDEDAVVGRRLAYIICKYILQQSRLQ